MSRFRREMPARRLLAALPVFFAALALLTMAIACGDGDNSISPSPTGDPNGGSPAASPATVTPAPPDAVAAQQAFSKFVATVQEDEIEDAWGLYIASVPGGEFEEHNEGLGCQFPAFGAEFPRMQHMFARIAPLELVESFGSAGGNLFIELKVLGADGNEYLARLLRDPAHVDYRVQSFNSGRPALELGVPDPFPSPEDPQGFCAIWTGPR